MLYQGSDEGINSIWICMGECFTSISIRIKLDM